MDEKKFVALCKQEVIDYVRLITGKHIDADDVYVVWLCKTLQNSKALLSTNIRDGMYYELTYNGDKGELYVDAYEKVNNFTVIV